MTERVLFVDDEPHVLEAIQRSLRKKVEVQTAANKWTMVIDRSQSTEDMLIDYRECPPTPGTMARLVILGAPPGITPGLAEFTVFGEVRKQ